MVTTLKLIEQIFCFRQFLHRDDSLAHFSKDVKPYGGVSESGTRLMGQRAMGMAPMRRVWGGLKGLTLWEKRRE